MVEGIQQLHHHKLSHGNLSMDGIYYDGEGNIAIDTSNIAPENSPSSFESEFLDCDSRAHCKSVFSEGSFGMFLNYLVPPESYFTSKPNLMKVDIWAIGCIALELLHGLIDQRNRNHPYNFTKNEFIKNNLSSDSTSLIDQINHDYQPIDYSQESDTSNK